MDVSVLDKAEGQDWWIANGDCVDVARGLPDESVGLTVFSPPFESLYTFSDHPRDMSNCPDQGVLLPASDRKPAIDQAGGDGRSIQQPRGRRVR